MIDKRYELECEYLALLINRNDLIPLTQINLIQISDETNQKIFEFIQKSFKQYGCITLDNIDPGIIDKYTELYINTYYDLRNPIVALEYYEREIDNAYKQDKFKELYEKTINKKVDYNKFILEIKRLDNISVTTSNNELSFKELEDNLVLKNIGISFNCFPKLSSQLKLMQNDLLVVGATTGVGKSGFLLNLFNDLMQQYQCVYFNLEMSKSSIYRRLVSINADIPINAIDTPTDYQNKLIKQAETNIVNSKVTIIHQINNVNDIAKIIAKKKNKDKHTIIFIDHIGLLKSQSKKSLYEEATETIKELRQICLEYGCTIIAASQLNRTAYASKEKTLNMLKDSGEVENSARKIILLYYAEDSNKEDLEPNMFVDIAKNDSGMTGVIQMQYFKVKQIFKEI